MSRPSLTPGWILAIVVPLLAGIELAAAVAPDADDRHLQSLCEQGLADVAAAYCQARLAQSSDRPGEAARWTMRWMEAEAQSALRSVTTAEQHWQAAKKLLADFEQRTADDPRLPWLRWQAVRNDLLKSQTALAAWLAAPSLNAKRETALATVREIEARLQQLDADLEHRLPLAAKQETGRQTQAPADQLLQLRLDASLLRCEAMLVRGQCYQRGSRDRIAAATSVSDIAGKSLERVPPTWPARENLLVARGAANLELGQRSEALSELQQLASRSPSPLIQARVASIVVDALIEDGDLDGAESWIVKLETAGDFHNSQLARVKLRLAKAAKLTGEEKQSALAELIDLTKSIGQRYGDYWRSRAEAIIVGANGRLDNPISSNPVGIELVLTEVRQLLAAGGDQAAIDKLIAAARTAKATNHLAQSIELSKQAYALLLKRQEWARAAEALLPLTAELSTTNGASEAHWLATRGLRQSLQLLPSDRDLRKRYEVALLEQIRIWPDSQDSEAGVQWLETWLLAQSRASELLDVLQARASAAAEGETQANSLRRWLSILAEQISESEVPGRREWLAQQLAGGRLAAARSTAEIVSLASLALTQWPARQRSHELAARIAAASGSSATDLDQQILIAVKILSAARAGEWNVAVELSKTWKPQELPASFVLAWTTNIVAAADQRPFAEHARWSAVTSAALARPDLVSESSSRRSIAARWRAHAWEGKFEQSHAELTALAEKYPREGNPRLQLALLTAEKGEAAYLQALNLARQVAAGSKKSSQLFLEARWLEIRLLQATGGREEARKIANHTLLTQEIPNDVWADRFNSAAQ